MDQQDPQQRCAPFVAYHDLETDLDENFPLFPLSGLSNGGGPPSPSPPRPLPSYPAIQPTQPAYQQFTQTMDPLSLDAAMPRQGMANNGIAPSLRQIDQPGSSNIAPANNLFAPTSSNMAPANSFFATASSPLELNYNIVGNIPDDWQNMSVFGGASPFDRAQGLDLDLSGMPPIPTHEWKGTSSIFDILSKKALGRILDYVGATWNGEMPNLVIALRPSILSYKKILEHFVDTNTFVLCPGNNWSLGGMSPQVIGRIKHLELAVCVCNLTDGDNKWVLPEKTWGPTEKGLTSVKTVTLYPSNTIKHFRKLTEYPASQIAHRCSKEEVCLVNFIKRYPIFLRPFDNLRATTIHVCLAPFTRVNQLAKADQFCRYFKSSADLHLRNPTTTVEYEVDGRTGLACQKWVWKVADEQPGINWRRVWKAIVPPHLHDFSNMVDWSGDLNEDDQAAEGGQDISTMF